MSPDVGMTVAPTDAPRFSEPPASPGPLPGERTRATRTAGTVMAHRVARTALRSGALWGVVFRAYVALQDAQRLRTDGAGSRGPVAPEPARAHPDVVEGRGSGSTP
jgi:hypothetical protein